MKRRNLNKQPGMGDFKNKCSEMVKRYDAGIIRRIYESIHETVYWKGAFPHSIKKDIILEMQSEFRKQRIIVLHLDPIVTEILSYFSKFLILLDSETRKQN
ncbi:MAG: hypothetical protein IPL26_05180 [Leptospiraceae bacterium]|nr:hypothetical protein [Leptospiraceae bacterium]